MRALSPLAVLVLMLNGGAAYARGGMAAEEPFNPEHFESLPPEVRAAVARICGPEAHAEHYFATFFDNSRLIKLHFEHAHCRNDLPLCLPSGCLHQEYGLSGGHYRLLRSYYGSAAD